MRSRSSASGSSASQALSASCSSGSGASTSSRRNGWTKPDGGVDGEQRRVAGAGDAHVHDAALLLDLGRAPARDVAVVVGDDDRVVLAALGGVDGADDHAVLLGLLARERVVGDALVRLLVGAQAVPGAQVGRRVRVGLGEQQERVEDLERAGAVGARAVAGRGRVGLRGPEVVERRRPRRPSRRGPRRRAARPPRARGPQPSRRARRARRAGAARPQAPRPRPPAGAPTAARPRRRPRSPRRSA